MLQKIENRMTLPPEMAQEQENNLFLEKLSRMVMEEFPEHRDREIDLTVQAAMVQGHLTSFYTPEREVTPARVIRNGHLKSAWFLHAAHLGLEQPCVLNYSFSRKPEENTEPAMKENEEEVSNLLNRLGQQPYLWSTSEKLTIFAAKPSEIKFLPGDLGTEQASASGLVFTPGADPGKIGKRLRAYSGAPGVFFDPQPSTWPELNLGGDFPLRLKVRNSGTVGDGGGACPQYIAKEILALSHAPLWGDIIAFQMVALGADFSFKGLINIVPDELWTHKGFHLVVDAKSVNHQVHSTLATLGKVIPTRHHRNERYFYVEPMNLGEVVNRFIDADQLTEQVMVIAENVDRETWERAMSNTKGLMEELLENTESKEKWDSGAHIRRAVRRQPEERNGLMLAHQESLGSPFGLPSITSLVAEGPAKRWARQLRNSRKKSENRKENPTLTGIMVSGEKLLLMDPGYAGVTYPRRGYVRLIWHPRRENQLIGVALSKADTLELRDSLDGMDVDGDKLQMIPMQDDRGTPLALLMRSPMSIDGGACLRLTLKDAARLREVGYHFYRKTGEHKYPGLYRIEEEVQVYPDVLHAEPHEHPPQWTMDSSLMVRRTLEINQYRDIMGQVCLAAANLDQAGLYDPSKHKFNMSEEVIDPSLNGSANPTPVLMPLQKTILEAVRKGIPVDRCLFPRIRKGIREMFWELHPGEEFKPILTCPPHHHKWKEGQEAANRFLTEQVKGRGLMAHGPEEWLTITFRAKLYNIVVRALEEGMAIWADTATEEKLVKKDETSGANWPQKEAKIARLIKSAKEDETAVVKESYQRAVRTVDDLEPGQFMAAWVQAAISRSKRSRRFKPIRVGTLLTLPPDEIRGFFRRGESAPTAIIRTEEKVEIAEGTACHVKQTGRNAYQLVNSYTGEIIVGLKPEANFYLDLKLEYRGYLPKLRVTLRKDNTWEQAKDQMVFQVKTPEDA